ncbi:MAG: metallophosphoesterase family protein [Methanoregula sp.]|jgi:calcineurin-like phosphoesterase family protein
MSLIDKIFRIKKKTFLISDLHFGHELTLLFVPRPFESTHDMNVALVKNWNDTVKSGDVIWHLGDLNWTQRPKFWIHKLHGKVMYIQGNHDRSRWMKRYAILRRGEHAFFLVHDPDDYVIPESYKGWIIHGHHHGGRDKDGNLFPFIDGINKRINVVAELINYRPVDLDRIVSLDLDTIKWMSTINDVPQRWAEGEEKPPLPVPRAKPKLRPRSKWYKRR